MQSQNSIVDRALNEPSTMWSIFTGVLGQLTVSEWCIVITAIITALNFIKSWYIDMRKLKMLEEEHFAKLHKEDHENEIN